LRIAIILIAAIAALVFVVLLAQGVEKSLGVLALPVVALAIVGVFFLWRAYRKRRRLHVAAFNELLAQTPAQFESTVAELLRDLGYRNVQQVGGSGDLAADLTCQDRKRRSLVVQCKRYAPGARVGSKDMQAFIGMVNVHHQADGGIFVTTSEFTDQASALAREHDITLIDGQELRRLVGR
jgi:restriction system protein